MHAPRRRRRGRRALLCAVVVVAAYGVVTAMVSLSLRRREEKRGALEISGDLRTFEDVIESWKRHLLPALGKVDIFAACVDAEAAETARLVLRERLASAGAERILVAVRDHDDSDAVPFFGAAKKPWRIRPAPGHDSRPAAGWLAQ